MTDYEAIVAALPTEKVHGSCTHRAPAPAPVLALASARLTPRHEQTPEQKEKRMAMFKQFDPNGAIPHPLGTRLSAHDCV